MITRIRLKNWKSHLDSELSFSKGVNGIVGIMGSGKSSIMQAISFALYGTFSGLGSRRVGIDDLIMSKPQQKSSAEIEMEFLVDGKTYTIKRRIDQGKGTKLAEIREDSSMLEVNPQGVTNQVTRILQTDYDLFSRAVYSEQNGLDYFLNIPKGKRMAQIDGMLKLDLYEKARENSVRLRNRLAIAREEKIKIIEEMKSKNLDERIGNLTREIEGKMKEMETVGKDYEIINKKRTSISEGHEKTRNGMEAFRKSVTELNGRMMFLRNQNEDIRKKTKEIEGMKKKLEELRKILGEKPEETIEKMKKDIDSSKAIIHRNHAISEQTNKSLNDIGGVEGKCPVCESELSNEKKELLINQRKESISKLSADIEKLIIVIDREQNELSVFTDKYDEFRDISKSLKESEGQDKKINDNEKEIDNIRKEVAGIAENMKTLETKEKEAGEKLSKINEKFGELRNKKDTLSEMIADKESVLSDLKNDYGMFLRYNDEVEKFKYIDQKLSKFTDVLRGTQDQLRDEFLKTVNYIMNSVWSELYPYGDFSEIQLAIDNDYVLQLKGSKGWTSVDLVSGGERTLASLTLRIAFSLAFTPNLRWLILDEPTHNLDKNAIRHFGNILKDKMGDFIDQVFLITHEESLSDYITGSLYKMERNKEMDGVTKVVAV